MRRIAVYVVGLPTIFTALATTLAWTAFAAGRPFMPCCFNPATGAAKSMVCCIVNISMECCKRFL